MRTPLDKSINMNNIEMRPSSKLRSGDGGNSFYEEYGAVDIDEFKVDVREISEENGNETDKEEYEAYDRDNLIIYEPYRHIESHAIGPSITKKKDCAIFLVVAISGLAVGLAVHFTKPPFPSAMQSTISSMTTPTTIKTEPHETGCDTPGKFFSIPQAYPFPPIS